MEDKIELLRNWFNEICLGDKDLYIKNSEAQCDPDKGERKYKFILYTDNYEYFIRAVDRKLDDGYLGCVMNCRKPRAGENWTRGNDLPDGPFNQQTWNSIKNSIISHELVRLQSR